MESTPQSHPKSIKGIRLLRKKQGQLIQGPKRTIFVKGTKCSQPVLSFMRDLRSLRKQRSVYYSRKHEVHPFESRQEIQNYCQKNDASLFVFGSHSKKRPNNLVIGRTYEGKILDIVELGIIDMKSISDIVAGSQIPINSRPFLIFQGDVWETDQSFKKLRNLFNDFFYQNNKVVGIQINRVMKVLVSITALDNKHIFIRVFDVDMEGPNILEEQGKMIVQELGPNLQLVLRRHQFADSELLKKATYVPKPKKKKSNKNVKYDTLGNKRGKLYLDRQNLNVLPTKRRKLISKQPKTEIKQKKQRTDEKINQDQHQNEFAN